MKVILLLGDFTFLDLKLDGKLEATVNRIDKVMLCNNSDEAGNLAEAHLSEGFEGYLIPTEYLENPKAVIKWGNIIDEDSNIVFESYEQLSYNDMLGTENVMLFIDNNEIAPMKVWCDSEMDDREYLTINHTIVYLDTLTNDANKFICGSCGEHVASYTFDEDRDIDVCVDCK